jgi:hypothetical protein
MPQIILRRFRTDLDLEEPMLPLGEFCLGLLDVPTGIAACQCPSDRKRFVELASQQLIGWHVHRARHRIDDRHLDGRFGEAIPLASPLEGLQQPLELPRILLHGSGTQVVVDDVLDRLRRLFTPRRAADGGGFSVTHRAIRQSNLNHNITLMVDRSEREPMGADGGYVNDPTTDVVDAHCGLILSYGGGPLQNLALNRSGLYSRYHSRATPSNKASSQWIANPPQRGSRRMSARVDR